MKRFTSKTQRIGELGEEICCKWLKNNGFVILDRNYTRRSGEIDIIANNKGVLHFIEVKSVSYETSDNFIESNLYNPAENVTRYKIEKCYSVIGEYLHEHHVSHETKYQFDVYLVYIDNNQVSHKIKRIENVILE